MWLLEDLIARQLTRQLEVNLGEQAKWRRGEPSVCAWVAVPAQNPKSRFVTATLKPLSFQGLL